MEEGARRGTGKRIDGGNGVVTDMAFNALLIIYIINLKEALKVLALT